MIRFLLRFIGMWLLAGGFVALVLDGVRSIASSSLVMTPLGVTWLTTSEASLASTQQFIETNLPSGTWNVLMVPLLGAPLFVVLGAAGLLLIVLGRPRSR